MAPRAGSTGEDDGYLVTLTTDMNADASYCLVFDAARVADGPVCKLRLPERISSGTHSTWATGSTVATLAQRRLRGRRDRHCRWRAGSRQRIGGTNAVGRMLGLLGDEWTLLVIQQALMGATRYGEFQARLPISHSVLSSRLQSLTRDGLLTKRTYQTNPPRAEYLITPRSRSLWPVLVSIWEWERHWVPDHAERLARHAPHRVRRRLRPAVDLPLVRRDGKRERRCRAMGPERFLGTVGAHGRDPAAVGGGAATRQAGLFPQTMSVLGNRWAFALLVAAFVGISRFTDFQTQLGAPPGSIADRLSIFAANGVLAAADNRYRLTEKGRALFPVLIIGAAVGAAVVSRARRTRGRCSRTRRAARPFTAVLTCDQCTRPLRGHRSPRSSTLGVRVLIADWPPPSWGPPASGGKSIETTIDSG